MKNKFSVSPLSILLVILISGIFYSAASAALMKPITTGPTTNPPIGDVTPTFSGVTVTGTADLEGDVTVGETLTSTSQPTGTSPKALFTVQGLGLVDAHILDVSSLTVDKQTAGDMIIYDDLTVGPNYREAGHWASPVTTLNGVTRHLTGPITLGAVNLDNNTVLGEVLYIGNFDAWNVPANKRNNGDVVIQGDLTVGYSGTGKIYADQVGSFYRRMANSSTGGTVNVSCDAGSTITGCSGYSTTNGFKGSIPAWNTSTCWAYTTSGTVYAYATCFDPTGVITSST